MSQDQKSEPAAQAEADRLAAWVAEHARSWPARPVTTRPRVDSEADAAAS